MPGPKLAEMFALTRRIMQAPDVLTCSIRPSSTCIDYADVRLELSSVADALVDIMPRVKGFSATAMGGFGLNAHDPWGSYEEDAYCYGFDQTCFIKIDPADGMVKQVWFECRAVNADRLSALARAMRAVDALAESAIADYWLDRVGRIRDTAFLSSYLQELSGEPK